VSAKQGPELHLDVSAKQGPELHLDVSARQSLSSTWTANKTGA
jgi:hypothetical protein